MLSRQVCLGKYGELFGAPKISLKIHDNNIKKIEVIRGAPCGATWDAAKKIKGLNLDKARIRFGLEVQFFCTANPANWDPITEKSPVHMAANIHEKAFKKSLKSALKY